MLCCCLWYHLPSCRLFSCRLLLQQLWMPGTAALASQALLCPALVPCVKSWPLSIQLPATSDLDWLQLQAAHWYLVWLSRNSIMLVRPFPVWESTVIVTVKQIQNSVTVLLSSAAEHWLAIWVCDRLDPSCLICQFSIWNTLFELDCFAECCTFSYEYQVC